MKARELASRCLKARILSWLTVTPQAVILPGAESPHLFAVYFNGRYIEPTTITIPDGVPPGWGPDGPVQQPGAGGGDKPGGGEDDKPAE